MAIAMLTDFGTSGYFVGAMKGSILSVAPDALIIDITHDIPNHDIGSGAFTLAACYRDFPVGTIFIAVVDPGVGSDRRAIAVEAGGRIFVAPDNGILSFVFNSGDGFEAYAIENECYFGPRRSTTFHGRDIFAPVAAHISLGVPLADLGPAVTDTVMIENLSPLLSNTGELIAEVIDIDRFGNLVTNLRPKDLHGHFHITLNGNLITRVCRSYDEAGPDELFLIEGSAGFIEISLNKASAARRTETGVGQKLTLSS